MPRNLTGTVAETGEVLGNIEVTYITSVVQDESAVLLTWLWSLKWLSIGNDIKFHRNYKKPRSQKNSIVY